MDLRAAHRPAQCRSGAGRNHRRAALGDGPRRGAPRPESRGALPSQVLSLVPGAPGFRQGHDRRLPGQRGSRRGAFARQRPPGAACHARRDRIGSLSTCRAMGAPTESTRKRDMEMTKRTSRIALLACAAFASLGLVFAVSPAAAKTKAKKKTVTKTATFNQCVSTASPIDDPESALASAAIPVSVPNFKGGVQDGVVTAITSAGVRLTHTSDGDLVITLVSPGGKVIPLAIGEGSSGDGYGTGATSCSGSLVQFGDSFTTPISTPGNTGNNPITGSFLPEQPLNQTLGGPARGNWILLVADEAQADVGSLDAFSLNFTYSYKAQVKKKKGKK